MGKFGNVSLIYCPTFGMAKIIDSEIDVEIVSLSFYSDELLEEIDKLEEKIEELQQLRNKVIDEAHLKMRNMGIDMSKVSLDDYVKGRR